MIDKYVLSMFILRMSSGSIEIAAAYFMYRVNEVEKALMINSGLALVGPTVLIATTTIGLAGMADKLSLSKMAWIFVGVSCLFIGVLKK